MIFPATCSNLLPLLLAVVAACGGASEKDGGAIVSKEDRVLFPGIGEYFFNGVLSDWASAVKACKDGGGHLAVVDSEAEATVLKQLMNTYVTNRIHLGFHDLYVEGSYVTIKYDPVDENCAWADGEPAAGTTYNCGFLNEAGLGVGTCDHISPSFCEIPLWNNYTTVTGYGRYRSNVFEVSWQEAVEACASEGAHLWIINSQEEIDAVQASVDLDTHIWLGAHRLYGDEEFVTIFDRSLEDTGYVNWYPGDPMGDSTTHPFLSLHFGSDPGLHSNPDTIISGYVCEYNFV